MTTVKTDIGRTFRFVEHRPSEWNPKVQLAIWVAPCATCGTPFEVTSPRLNPARGRIDAQMAFRSGVWRKYFSVARCPGCRAKRKA